VIEPWLGWKVRLNCGWKSVYHSDDSSGKLAIFARAGAIGAAFNFSDQLLPA
jgi:hypothetical protein